MIELTLHVKTTEKVAPEEMGRQLTQALAGMPELKPAITHPGPGRSAVFDAVKETAAVLTVTLPTIHLVTKNIDATRGAVDAVLRLIPRLKDLFRALGYGAQIEVGTGRIPLEAADRPEAEKIVAWQERIQASQTRNASVPPERPPLPGERPRLTQSTDSTTTAPGTPRPKRSRSD